MASRCSGAADRRVPTDHGTLTLLGHQIAGWRFVFYVNLPMGLIALFMIMMRMPQFIHKASGRIDYLGALLFVAGFVPFLLALSWAGGSYGWGSARVLGAFAFSAVVLAGFVYAELGNPDALIPMGLFRIKVFSIASSAALLINMAFMGTVVFLPLYMQVVQGVNATQSGWSTLPLLGGLILTSVLAGFLSSRTGRYKPFILFGFVSVGLGVMALTQIGPDTSTLDLSWRMFIVGIGLGPCQSQFNLAIQNAVPVNRVGVATSASQFFRQIGATVGVAVFGTFLTSNLGIELPKHLPQIPGASAAKIDMGEAQSQAMNPNRIHDQVKDRIDAQYRTLEDAAHGDAAALGAVEANSQIPDSLKQRFQKAQTDPAEREGLAKLLPTIRAALDHQVDPLVAKITRGTKEAFSVSVTQMFKGSLPFILAGLLVALFLPEIPLRARRTGDEPKIDAAA